MNSVTQQNEFIMQMNNCEMWKLLRRISNKSTRINAKYALIRRRATSQQKTCRQTSLCTVKYVQRESTVLYIERFCVEHGQRAMWRYCI